VIREFVTNDKRFLQFFVSSMLSIADRFSKIINGCIIFASTLHSLCQVKCFTR